ncbi:metalloprotease TldD [Amphiplicatus metriothermophilus]|uniref:TldD protein n=1 Tax=Amphiplicatus metriothermophilus TaxID=1519374 RepID=A0A239PIX5_9PROT|nr:metalloprotease TldD [Amphiplicatus metriothermophilus]MBB5517939.1 TldD protein [Amphiplicatus metriothermophilus]SNT67728.1 TldD protein [Amphiplicatus metriothermophilus]
MTQSLFFSRAGLDRARVESIVDSALGGADDGELYLEYIQSESFVFDDNRLKTASFDVDQGFGLRAVCGESTGYAHASELSEDALKRAADAVQAVRTGHAGVFADGPARTNLSLYPDDNPLGELPFEAKARLLADINDYARAKDPRVRQVSASLSAEWSVVEIVRPGGAIVRDARPLVRIGVSVTAGDGERQETGSYGAGGREGYARFVAPETWRAYVDEALRQALVNLEAEPAPAGETTVVLGPGWTGILLHEAVGHGLEGDFNRKKTSAFAGRLGERVAAPGVTVVDDGTIAGRRGSLTVDDEGTPTSRTVLIEDGVLKGYLQDRLNARLMGAAPTGNGRRESYASPPLPRMTNTFMLAGPHDPEEIIRSVKDGVYAVNFSGGQVDITSGKFVFNCTEAYRVKDGKIGVPLKNVALIGDGPSVLARVSMIGSDFALDPGVGVCGKAGQGVPVGVGQPTIKIDRLTVGGSGA